MDAGRLARTKHQLSSIAPSPDDGAEEQLDALISTFISELDPLGHAPSLARSGGGRRIRACWRLKLLLAFSPAKMMDFSTGTSLSVLRRTPNTRPRLNPYKFAELNTQNWIEWADWTRDHSSCLPGSSAS